MLLRAVCGQLHLPLAWGLQKLGLLARATENPAVFLETVRGWTSWSCLAEEIKRARELLVPVCLDDNKLPRDCVYAVVTAAEAGQTLGAARLLRVVVHDAIGRPHCARGLAQNLEMLVRGAVGCRERAGSVQLEIDTEFPECESSSDRCIAVFGLLMRRVAQMAGDLLECSGGVQVRRVRECLRSAFAEVRAAVDLSGKRDVLVLLQSLGDGEAECGLLRRLGWAGARSGGSRGLDDGCCC